jgi:fructose-bisphosphate aldolase class II
MPLATPRQYAAMLDAAADGGYAYAAINVTSSETLNAALRGFELANAVESFRSRLAAPSTCPGRQ